MGRLLVLIVAVSLVAALIGSPRLKRALAGVAVLLIAYAVLKAAGVVDAVFPSRSGVF